MRSGQSLSKVAIHSVAFSSSPTEERLLSLRGTEALDLGKDGDDGMGGETRDREGETDFSCCFPAVSPILTLSVHRYFQERL